MAKRRRKTSKGWLAGMRTRLGSGLSRRQALWLVAFVLAGGLLTAMAVGMARLEQYVYSLPEYQKPVRVELVNLPDWLTEEANQHIVESIRALAGVTADDRILDNALAGQVGRRVGESGWISRVISVRKRYGGVVEVDCDFRQPLAWVMHGDSCYLIDANCVRLPGRYSHAQIVSAGMVQILGVGSAPTAPGLLWTGQDLRAGVEVATMLATKPFREQVTAILVYNYDGREDTYRPHIELATDRPGRIRWGRAPGEELSLEPTAVQKMALLTGLYNKYHRVDMGQPYVDIRRSPYEVDVPIDPAAVEALRS